MNYKTEYIKLKIKRITDALSGLPFIAVMFLYSDKYLSNGLISGHYVIDAKPFFTALLMAWFSAIVVVIIGYSLAYIYTESGES